MWQPPANKHLYETTGYFANDNAISPPNEIPGHFSATPNYNLTSIINYLTPNLVNNLQEYLKYVNRLPIMIPNQNHCSSTTFNGGTKEATSSDPSIYFSPPPPPLNVPTTVSNVLNTLPLDILTDTFIRLNTLHLSNGNNMATLPTEPYYSSGTSLHIPPHLQLFKQYLNMEQQHLKQLITPNTHSTTTSFLTAKADYYNYLINKGLHLSSSSSSSNCDLNHHRPLRKRKDDLKDLLKNSNSGELKSLASSTLKNKGNDLFPPPKKKWIRHYLKEVGNSNNANAATSFMLLSNSTTSKLSTTSPIPPAYHEQQDETVMKQNLLLKTKNTGPTTTTFTLIDSNGEIVRNAAASKQMLLTNGIRIASSSATIGQQQQQNVMGLSTKAINIPLNNKNIPILSGFPYQLPPITPQQQQQSATNAAAVGGGSSMILSNRHKTFTPLTPPPMSSRKFVEPTHSRIRSFSLSSHKISANNHQLHVQNHNSNNNNSTISMVVDEIPPTQQQQHLGFTTTSSSSSQHSPPRHASAGASSLAGMGGHYMHMQTGNAGHATPRRRTISSTSNGAGTREVHNKLEKNRRAHLKECYEALKNELSLKDEDRRKTSNLAILSEALRSVQAFQKRNSDLEAEWEQLGNDKINLQKRIVSLKRELGPKYDQIFSGIFPDIEIGSIPSERETINDTHSLSSGRGSTLYSSSSSLSSGGSNGSSSGSNTMSSPVGAGLQTAMPTAISPVITKINNISNNISSTSPISITSNNSVMQQQRKNPSITTTIQAVAIPSTPTQGAAGNSSPPVVSPTTLVTFGSSLPLSLTAKNISATAVTRGSPTPSTPSPSPSSSSGVSSSSSLISSSPPINGVISNGRNVTVNIPNGLILQAAAAAATAGVVNGGGGVTLGAGTIGNGTAPGAATIIAAATPAQGVNNTNNAVSSVNQMTHQQQQQQQYNGRKKSLTLCNNNNNVVENHVSQHHQHHHHQMLHQQHQQQQTIEDGEQPAKFLKVFNSTTNGLHLEGKPAGGSGSGGSGGQQQKLLLTSNGGMITGVGGVVNNSIVGTSLATSMCSKSISNGSPCTSITTATNELCRLPGGAELNILPSKNVVGGSVATAFYHANGKITFINGSHNPHLHQQHPPSSPMSNGIPSSNGTTVTNGYLLKDATPLLVSAASTTTSTTANSVNGLHFAGNFAQLLAAANPTTSSNNSNVPAAASIFPMTSFQSVAETKTKNNSKSSIVTWRSGAATTN